MFLAEGKLERLGGPPGEEDDGSVVEHCNAAEPLPGAAELWENGLKLGTGF